MLEPMPQLELAKSVLQRSTPALEKLQAMMLRSTAQMELVQAALGKHQHNFAIAQVALPSLPKLDAVRSALINHQVQFDSARASLSPLMGVDMQATLRPMMLDSLKLLPAIDAFDFSVGRGGAYPFAADLLSAATPSKALLDALSIAGDVISGSDRHRDLAQFFARYLRADSNISVGPADTREVGQELSAAADTGNLSSLSEQSKQYMMLLLAVVSLLLSQVANFSGARQELCFWQPKLLPEMTSGQMGKAIRRFACDAPSDVLKNMRFVKGTGVQLRERPSTKGRVLPVSLSEGDLLDVISADNRDWLLVSVVSQEGVEGWISRRYAKQVRR